MTIASKPIILCPAAKLTAGVERLYVNKAYEEAVAKAGGILLMVGSREPETWDCLLETVADGVLFQGGCHIHPRVYGEEATFETYVCDTDRDSIELHVMRRVIAMNI